MAKWIKMDAEAEGHWIAGDYNPLEVRTSPEGDLEVWMPHTFSERGRYISGTDRTCWHCGLLPLDYDATEFDCVQDEVG